MNLKKIYRFSIKNYFIVIFFVIVGLVGFISLIKLFYSKPTYVYAKVKLGQGLWWASTNKPSVWFIGGIKKGQKEYNLLGKPIAEIIDVRYYNEITDNRTDTNKFSFFLTVKLAAALNNRIGQYTFKRAVIAIGSPIDLIFPSSQISGTVIELDKSPLNDNLVTKTILLTSKFNYPWEFDAIKIGDRYFDGIENVFEVLGKAATDVSVLYSDAFGNVNTNYLEPKKYIIVKAKIKLKEKNHLLIFGEEQVVKIGAPLSVTTENFNFDGFVVGSIE